MATFQSLPKERYEELGQHDLMLRLTAVYKSNVLIIFLTHNIKLLLNCAICKYEITLSQERCKQESYSEMICS